jgi:hypothetical protein
MSVASPLVLSYLGETVRNRGSVTDDLRPPAGLAG